jgi:hypothetical protein
VHHQINEYSQVEVLPEYQPVWYEEDRWTCHHMVREEGLYALVYRWLNRKWPARHWKKTGYTPLHSIQGTKRQLQFRAFGWQLPGDPYQHYIYIAYSPMTDTVYVYKPKMTAF